jgi:hypothetical protein
VLSVITLLVISEPVLSKKILALQMQGTDSHDGEEDGTWSRTYEAFRDQSVVPDLSDVAPSHGRMAIVCLHRTILHQVAQRLLPPRADVRDWGHARHFRTCFRNERK